MYTADGITRIYLMYVAAARIIQDNIECITVKAVEQGIRPIRNTLRAHNHLGIQTLDEQCKVYY